MKQGTKEQTTIEQKNQKMANPYQAQAYGLGMHSAEEREQLILEHLPQVRLIARRIHDRLPESVSLDDLTENVRRI
jgi:DNA-directed RNA polymerase specialized sigma subunit